MPNICENELIISGVNVAKVLDFIQSPASGDEDEQIFDYNKLIPYPQEFAKADKRAKEYADRFCSINRSNPDELALLNQDYGLEPDESSCPDGFNQGGYDWCVDHWGTKWNAYSTELAQTPNIASINFHSAWAPPLPVIKKLAETFPEFEFDFQYFEGGMGFCGHIQYRNRREVLNISDNYDGPKGG